MSTPAQQTTSGMTSMERLVSVDIDSIRMRCAYGYYDYIIVGSGFGGGILSEQLVEKDKKVLIIEKGGPLFSTHVVNTPRPDYARGRDDSQEGNEIIYAAVKQNIQTAENSEPYVGGPMYCLGGRSNVWGLWTPEAHADTLETYFPPAVRQYLTTPTPGTGTKESAYKRAFNLMSNNSQRHKIYPDGVIDEHVLTQSTASLSNTLTEYEYLKTPVVIGPIATEMSSTIPYRFPQGAYSTTVALLNRIYARDERCTVLMNHDCLQVEFDPSTQHKQVKCLTLRSVIDQKLHHLKVDVNKTKVILAAGTLGSAKIALNSGLQLYNPLVGKGMIDHEVFALRFAKERIGKTAPPLYLQCVINVLGTIALLTVTINANYLLSSGGRGARYPIRQYITKDGKILNDVDGQNRYGSHAEKDMDTMQILLEFRAPLDDNNEVLNVATAEPVIRCRRPNTHTDEASQVELQKLATIIRDSFRDDCTPTIPPPGQTPGTDDLAPRMDLLGFGVFSHEVGTMRMPSPSYEGSVVDENLRVKGFDNLYVCDLSVFPCSTEANPTLTLAGIVLKLADHLGHQVTTVVA